MKRLVLITLLAIGCTASPPAPSASDFEAEGLRHDRYVLLESPAGSAAPRSADRERLELEWPEVDELSLPGDPSVRRVRSTFRAGEPGLRPCTARVPEGQPCHGEAPLAAPPQHSGDGAVILRVEANGYGAPGLELSTR